MKNFEAGCRSAGFEPDHLWVTARVERPSTSAPARRVVTVERGTTLREYEDGPAHNWVSAAIADVQRGEFGR